MNCDPDRPHKPGGRALHRLREAVWKIPTPEREWSFISNNGRTAARIDHAICNPGISVAVTIYATRIAGFILAGQTSDNAISDHAALLVKVDMGHFGICSGRTNAHVLRA